MPRSVVLICRLLDDFDNKGRKVCCKVSLYKNCQRQWTSDEQRAHSAPNFIQNDSLSAEL